MRQWPWNKRNRVDCWEAITRDTTEEAQATRRAAFERLVEEAAADFHGAALRMTRNRDDASDLLQETLLRAYAAFDTFTPGTNFRAWVLRILTNNYLMLYRRRRLVQFVPWDDFSEIDQNRIGAERIGADRGLRQGEPEPALLDKTMDPHLEAALGRLSEGVRLVLLLVEVEELSYEQTAVALGVPIGTVRSRLKRGREQMQRSLTDFARERGLKPAAGETHDHGPV